MRISTNQLYDQNIRAIMQNQRDLARTDEDLITGKRINRPSEDPVGAAKVIRLTEELAGIKQYKRNSDMFSSGLEQQEAVLTNINDAMQRARTLVLQAGSGSLNEADRLAIGAQIEQIRDEVLDLMNAQDADGDYIFSGHQSQNPAFAFNPSASANAVTFQGDSGTNSVKLSDSVTARSTTSGQDVFENVLARLEFSSVGAGLTSSEVIQQNAFDSFHKSNYDPTNPDNNKYEITLLGSGEAQLSHVETGDVVETVDFTSGEPFTVKGMSFTITGAPGDTVDLSLNPPEKKNIAQTLHEMYRALSVDRLDGAALQGALNNALVGMDNGVEKLAVERSSIGARLNTAQSVYETNLDLEIAAESARSSIEDTDYAEASANFARQEAALNAAMQTFPKIANLSLFNYI